jgi:hypothetical protein
MPTMRVKTLDKAVKEAKRFLKAADAVKKLSGTDEYIKGDPWYQSGQYCAAVKRASMDLSRALADVRR